MNTPPEIQVLDLPQKQVDLSKYKMRQALETDYSTFIDRSTVLTVDGEPRIVYLDLDEFGADPTELVAVLQTMNFTATNQRRTNGLQGATRALGWHPRRTLRQDFCHISALAEENPRAHTTVVKYAEQVSRWYEQYNPDLYAKHNTIMLNEIRPDYQLPQSVFTSGVINKNNSIPYHFDAGNFKDVWSCMLAFKKDVKGGYLSCPEFDLGFEIKNNSLLMFDGQGILHGVTPIKLTSRKAYRYTVVYYSLQQIWNCLPITEELERIRKVKTEREQKRAGVLSGKVSLEEAYPEAAKRKKQE